MTGQTDAVIYDYMNVGLHDQPSSAAVIYDYMNVGLHDFPSKHAVIYDYFNVVDPPSSIYISDAKTWIRLTTWDEADSKDADTLYSAKNYTNKMVSHQGVPAGGKTGQILKKVSGSDYDFKWANEASAGGGSLPPGGSVNQILIKDSTLDGDATWHDIPTELPVSASDGLVLLSDSTQSKKTKWGAIPGGSRDRITVCPAAWTSIDEFNDDVIGPNWARVDSAGASRCAWTEGGDTLSVYNSGGDANGELHALMMPISLAGGDMAVGDAFVTCITIAGHVQTSANHIGGILLSTTSTYGSGTQISAMSWTNASMAQMNHNPYKFTNFNTATSSPTSILTVHQRMFIRLVMTAANTWRHDISVDGVSWLPGTATTQTMVPAYVGLLDSSWGNTAKHVLAYEFFRRMKGVS